MGRKKRNRGHHATLDQEINNLQVRIEQEDMQRDLDLLGVGLPEFHTTVKERVPPKPPPKPLPPEAYRTVVDHCVDVPESFDKMITYVMSQNGLFEVRKSRLGLFVRPASTVLGLRSELHQGFQSALPKVPFELLAQTVTLFRAVCKAHNGSSEALVRFIFDTDTNQWSLEVPEQTVSSGSVDHKGEQNANGSKLIAVEVHSHGSSMSAFWSSVDDSDEVRFERVYGVIGKVNEPIPEWRWRAQCGGTFMDLDIGEVFEFPTVSVSMSELLRSEHKPMDPFANTTIPDEWLKRVKERAIVVHGGGAHTAPGRFPHWQNGEWNRRQLPSYYGGGNGGSTTRVDPSVSRGQRPDFTDKQLGGSPELMESSQGDFYLVYPSGVAKKWEGPRTAKGTK